MIVHDLQGSHRLIPLASLAVALHGIINNDHQCGATQREILGRLPTDTINAHFPPALRIQRITALIQPVIIMILAIMVGLFAYSILAGIFQAVSGLRPGR
ncbi:MAG: hypothetical protein M0Q93_11615 [Terrimicrobiaceae bacterium]|nr:hypothetical protein [Terrimicrobiaceae bacterium]